MSKRIKNQPGKKLTPVVDRNGVKTSRWVNTATSPASPAPHPSTLPPSRRQGMQRQTPIYPIEQVMALVDRKGPHAEMYRNLQTQHFSKNAVGSRFTKAESPESVLLTAALQRGNLGGDDRHYMQHLNPELPDETFRDDCRYLLVKTPGVLGIRNTETLEDDTIELNVVYTKTGCPPSIAFPPNSEYAQPTEVDTATVIIGPDPENPTQEIVWTMHPGHPTPAPEPNSEREAALFALIPENPQIGDCATVTVGWAKENLFDGENFWVQTQ